MQKILSCSVRILFTLLLTCTGTVLMAQNLKLSDFAIWGGGASPNPYNNAQGVFITNNANIQGNVGSNHLINIANNLTLKGALYSGNNIIFGNNAIITGNMFASTLGAG